MASNTSTKVKTWAASLIIQLSNVSIYLHEAAPWSLYNSILSVLLSWQWGKLHLLGRSKEPTCTLLQTGRGKKKEKKTIELFFMLLPHKQPLLNFYLSAKLITVFAASFCNLSRWGATSRTRQTVCPSLYCIPPSNRGLCCAGLCEQDHSAPRFSLGQNSFLLHLQYGDSFTELVDDLLALMSYILWCSLLARRSRLHANAFDAQNNHQQWGWAEVLRLEISFSVAAKWAIFEITCSEISHLPLFFWFLDYFFLFWISHPHSDRLL